MTTNTHLSPTSADDLYARLESLSKSLEGSGRLDEHDNPDAYTTVLDAMNFVRAALAQPEPKPCGWAVESGSEPLLFNDRVEAQTYCDIGEEPIALYATPPAAPIDGFGGNLDEAFERAPAVPDGMALVPDYRGYAALGTGQYLLDISGDANPAELIIHVATDAEKEGRTVGDLRDKPNPGEVIQPEKMAVRLAFFTAAGLDALEQQLRILRETHFALSAAPAVPRHVRKIGGSFQHTGTVVAEFKTLAGEPRIVLEFDAPVAGMLHVYRPDQVEPCEQAHGIGGGK